MKFDNEAKVKIDIAFAMMDVCEFYVLEMEKKYIAEGEFRQSLKAHINKAKHHLRMLVEMVNKFNPDSNEDFGNNADGLKDLMDKLIEQILKKYERLDDPNVVLQGGDVQQSDVLECEH